MPTTTIDWWTKLGLAVTSRTQEDLLRAHPPTGFGDLTLDDLAARAAEIENVAALDEERIRGDLRTAQALAASDADIVIEEGRWAGFTRGEAIAWCWTLFQYEPHGFVHPGTQVRLEALAELEGGGIPEVFGYSQRARELAASGSAPLQYRAAKHASGARVFLPRHVTRRGPRE